MRVVIRSSERVAPSFEYLDIDGLRIRYRRAGDGPSLLFLHGWGARIESFTRLLDEFAGRHTVCAFDFPGFGESCLPLCPWGVEDFAVLTRGVIGTLGLERPDVIAHSFGGRVAIKLAAQHPEVVGRLVLVGTPGFRPPRSARYYLRVAVAKAARIVAASCGTPGAKFAARMRQFSGSADYKTAGPLRATLVRVVNEDLGVLLPRLAAKTLLVWGEDDREVPVTVAKTMAAAIPDASLVVIPRAGHFCFVERHDYFRLLVAKFLR